MRETTEGEINMRRFVLAAAMMLCAGLCGFVTPKRAAVAGINCISPRAPLLLMAPALKPDS